MFAHVVFVCECVHMWTMQAHTDIRCLPLLLFQLLLWARISTEQEVCFLARSAGQWALTGPAYLHSPIAGFPNTSPHGRIASAHTHWATCVGPVCIPLTGHSEHLYRLPTDYVHRRHTEECVGLTRKQIPRTEVSRLPAPGASTAVLVLWCISFSLNVKPKQLLCWLKLSLETDMRILE